MIRIVNTLCVLALVGVLLTGGTTVAAQTSETDETAAMPDTASEYLTAFQEMNGTSAFDDYSEFEIMRSQAILAVQIGEFESVEQRRMELVLQTLRSFQRTYQLHQNGSYAAALETGEETEGIADELRNVEAGESYAELTDVAMQRFYLQTGQAIQSQAEEASSTPNRIEQLNRSAMAFKRSGSVDRYSRIHVRVDGIEKRFQSDTEQMNASVSAATQFTNTCEGCSSAVTALGSHSLAVLPKYRAAIAADREVSEARSLAGQHGLDDRQESIGQLHGKVTQMRTSLALASAVVITGYTVVIGLVAALVMSRLLTWRRDLSESKYGNVVLVGEILNG